MTKYVLAFVAAMVMGGAACATGTLGVDADFDAGFQTGQDDAGADTGSTEENVLSYDLGGKVTGLVGTGLILQNNGGDDVVIGADGAFKFPTRVATGKAFNVTVKTQPTNLSQTCTVTSGTGSITGASVDNVAVSCVTNKFTVGGTVVGLNGSGLVLQNNAGGDITIGANGTFSFPTSQDDGTTFAVTVKTDPKNPEQTCLVSGGTGTIAGSNVTSVTVNCSKKKYAIGGTVASLQGTGLVLQNNAGDDLTVGANGTFAFATPIDDQSAYAVTVKTQPSNKWQTCGVINGSGTVASAPVTNVAISCTTNSYKVKVTVSGLDGSGLVLQNNGGNNLAISANGTFEFTQPIASGSTYSVTTLTNPTNNSQTCTASNGTGQMAGADANVNVTCASSKYAVGGSVGGLVSGSVVLTLNGGNDLTIGANGTFSFSSQLASGSAYAVAVKTQPNDRECSVTNGSGTVGNGAVTTVSVSCEHAGCRNVNGLRWCKDTVTGRSCNTFCNAIGLGSPTISDSAWLAAQDTNAECSAIASAFGIANVSVGSSYTVECAEARTSDLACSTASACPTNHRTSAGTGTAVCPCAGVRVCGTAEEDLLNTITCPAGSVISSIDFASFGLPTGTCGSYATASCNTAASKSIVESKCLGKSTCSVKAGIDVFGDPCINVNKRLYIQATCQ